MSLTRDAVTRPSPLDNAPARLETPLPGSFTLSFDRATVCFDRGAVMMGGAPLRLWRLSTRAQRVVARWHAGEPIGSARSSQLLARRLASSGAVVPHPHGRSSVSAASVTVVVPVRDRPLQLERLLAELSGMACIVVDDASRQPELCRQIAQRHGARCIALEANVGPAAARNAGWACASTPLVAFIDSDCLPMSGWLGPLLTHFDVPMVAAAAPPLVPAPGRRATVLSRYELVRSSLDRGAHGGLVRAQSRIPYVPSAAVVVRRDVAGPHLFDQRLRAGEDVDLVWRLAAAGWDVRYEPSSRVAHDGPASGLEFMARRAFYGTSAAPLSDRHPDVMAPLQTSAWSAAAWALAITRRPLIALAVVSTFIIVLARRLRGLVSDPVLVAGKIAGGGTVRSALPALSGLARAWSPALAMGLLFGRTRRRAVAALLVPAVDDWVNDPGDLDLLRYAALHVADDLAYGTGVWAGCIRGRTVRPLLPRLSFRSPGWSSGSLRHQLGDAPDPV